MTCFVNSSWQRVYNFLISCEYNDILLKTFFDLCFVDTSWNFERSGIVIHAWNPNYSGEKQEIHGLRSVQAKKLLRLYLKEKDPGMEVHPCMVSCEGGVAAGYRSEASLGKKNARPCQKNKLKHKGLEGWLEWFSACLTRTKSWVQTPVLLPKVPRKLEESRLSDSCEIGAGLWICAHQMGFLSCTFLLSDMKLAEHICLKFGYVSEVLLNTERVRKFILRGNLGSWQWIGTVKQMWS
jgi:hypothetical protein